MPRRRAVRLVGAAVVAMAVPGLRPRSAFADSPCGGGTSKCGPDTPCSSLCSPPFVKGACGLPDCNTCNLGGRGQERCHVGFAGCMKPGQVCCKTGPDPWLCEKGERCGAKASECIKACQPRYQCGENCCNTNEYCEKHSRRRLLRQDLSDRARQVHRHLLHGRRDVRILRLLLQLRARVHRRRNLRAAEGGSRRPEAGVEPVPGHVEHDGPVGNGASRRSPQVRSLQRRQRSTRRSTPSQQSTGRAPPRCSRSETASATRPYATGHRRAGHAPELSADAVLDAGSAAALNKLLVAEADATH